MPEEKQKEKPKAEPTPEPADAAKAVQPVEERTFPPEEHPQETDAEVEAQIEAQRQAEEERRSRTEGKPKKYRVPEDGRPVMGHEPGETFEATLSPEQEERKLTSGALLRA